MRKLFCLTRVLIKSNLGSFHSDKKKKISATIIYILLALAMIPITFILHLLLSTSAAALKDIHEEGFILIIGFNAISLLIFIFSLFVIPSVYFFSKDSDSLLCLPLKPQTILGSKFIVTLIYELITSFIILIPLYIVYVQYVAPNFLYAIYAALVFITIPIFPLVLSSILLLFIMGFVPFFKNRDRFNMIASILGMLLAISINIGINITSRSFVGEQSTLLIQDLAKGDNTLLSFASYLLPNIKFAAKALVGHSIFNIFIYIAIVAISLAIFFIIGKHIYFKGAIGFNETSSSRKEISHTKMNKLNRHRNIIATYTAKELKIIVRTPIFALNCLSSIFMGPLLFIILIFSGNMSTSEVTTVLNSNVLPHIKELFPYAIVAGIIIGIFLASTTIISSTAISREGSNVYFMKYIPLSFGEQIQAKILSGVLISWLSILIVFICAYSYIYTLPLTFFIIMLIPALVSAVVINIFGIMIDIARPKLVWETEAAAVKRNLSGTVTLLSGWAICAILVFIILHLPPVYILPFSISIFIALILVIVLLNKYLDRYATKHFNSY